MTSTFLVNPPLTPSFRGAPTPYLTIISKLLEPRQACTFPVENLGMMQLHSFAKREQIELQVFDAVLTRDKGVEQTFQRMDARAQEVGAPSLIGFSLMESFAALKDLISLSKAAWPGVYICIGGLFATLNYQRILESDWNVDAVCVGDGEETFTELAQTIINGDSIKDIKGLAYLNNERKLVYQPNFKTQSNQPWASRIQTNEAIAQGFATAISTQRGCPYRCSFCMTGTTGTLLGKSSQRQRDVLDVVDEMEFLKMNYGSKYFTIVDDLFVSKHETSKLRAELFANELIKRQLDIHYMCDIRMDSFDEKLFRLLFQSGLRRVFVGIETGSNAQLKIYKKGYNSEVQETKRKLDSMLSLGVDVIPGTIMWHPEVKKEELLQTLEILDVLPYKAAFYLTSKAISYSGTPLHADYLKKGYLDEDFPIGKWHFQDPKMAHLYDLVFDSLNSSNSTYQTVRTTLLSEIENLESFTNHSSKGKIHFLHS